MPNRDGALIDVLFRVAQAERIWADKVFRRVPAPNGAPVTVWGM